MESVIDQIETNKSIIKKSANKLIAMLDISQWLHSVLYFHNFVINIGIRTAPIAAISSIIMQHIF